MADHARSRQTPAALESNASGTPVLPLEARRHPLVAEVRRRLTRYAGISGRARIVVGISGGPDSIALLIALLAISEQESSEVRPEPIITHVNHHLRDEADADAAFVRSLAERFAVPFVLKDVHPAVSGENLASTARAMRYAALADVARHRAARYIAVAHHAEDQFESMLMALCRGTGLDGLSAMAWARPLDRRDESIVLIRPLLASRKAECESLCAAAGIEWREDSSNQDISRRRNRLRLEVLPVLEECWPDAPVRAAMTAELLGEAGRILDETLTAHFGPPDQRQWQRKALAKLSPVMIAAGLRRAVLHARAIENRTDTEELTQRVLLPAAEAIADANLSPRQFTIVRGMTLYIRSQSIALRAS